MRERTSSLTISPKTTEVPEDIPEQVQAASADKASATIESKATADDLPTNVFNPESDLQKTSSVPRGDTEDTRFGGEEDDPAVLVSYAGSTSAGTTHKGEKDGHDEADEELLNRMHKFSLYETSTRFYLVGADIMDMHYRVLKIDRTSPPGHLSVFEDDIVYSKREMNQLLNAIDDGNKGTGGMKLKCSAWGLLGFVRFTEAYYMLLITKRSQVAMIGGHYVYQVDGTELIPLTTGSTSRFQKDRNPEEARFLAILNNMDLAKSFYFSYSYNITRSLQQNIIREREALNAGHRKAKPDFQDMFVWNHYLLQPASSALKNVYDWCHPITHGYIGQSSLDIYGRRVYITIIARRSRHFAGARFLKRGANDCGHVANDVETEQIVSDVLNTSFHAPGPRLYASPNYTSYVQHRGSIPLHWTQDNTGVTPKPDIDLSLVDPFNSAAALHFDDLFKRYGSPVYVLNLIKARERVPRESKLLQEYKNAIDYLNISLPKEHKIIYEAFDMSRASKTRGQDVIGTLEHIAEKVLRVTDFFRNGDGALDEPRVQNGVARTNCIDCLDRTNAAQFVIGKRALGRQLHALGVISGKTVDYDTDCVEIFTRMFHSHGDQIAIQYGGSHLVNTMSTYRKINHWQSSSRDMVESFKRYYHNSFLDSQRQEAYNLFLGNYVVVQDQPMLWDLTTDYYLHHQNPRFWLTKSRRDYIHWFNPEHLKPRTLPPSSLPFQKDSQHSQVGVSEHDDYWLEYYRPLALSSFLKIFAYRLNDKFGPFRQDKSTPMHPQDFSPFIVRKKPYDQSSPNKQPKKPSRKGVTILDPSCDTESCQSITAARRAINPRFTPTGTDSPQKQSILRDPHFETVPASSNTGIENIFPSLTASSSTGIGFITSKDFIPADKGLIHQWTLTQFYENSLNPSVSMSEEDEYSRYVEHPLNLPLVVSSETPSADDPGAFEYYEYLCMSEETVPYAPDGELASLQGANIPDTASIRSGLARPTSSMSMNTPFSHHSMFETVTPAKLFSAGRFQVPDEDIEEFEEYLRVEDNPLDVLEEDGKKKRYKAYRQWLKGRSFFKQNKMDPEWQNQLPIR